MEKDMIKLTPNLGVGFVFQILKFFGIILIIILSILYVNFLAGFNVPEFLWEIMKDSFSIVSEAFGGVGLDAYELSIYVVEDILTHIWVQIIAVLFLVVVSILGTRCYFYADKMVYKQGKIFQKERSVGFSRIKNISYDKYINWFNFGSITLLVQDEVLRAIKVDYVNNLETEYKKIKELVEGKKQQSEDSNKV